jgi:hypothetical protein
VTAAAATKVPVLGLVENMAGLFPGPEPAVAADAGIRSSEPCRSTRPIRRRPRGLRGRPRRDVNRRRRCSRSRGRFEPPFASAGEMPARGVEGLA